jgi:hypothetical protein
MKSPRSSKRTRSCTNESSEKSTACQAVGTSKQRIGRWIGDNLPKDKIPEVFKQVIAAAKGALPK